MLLFLFCPVFHTHIDHRLGAHLRCQAKASHLPCGCGLQKDHFLFSQQPEDYLSFVALEEGQAGQGTMQSLKPQKHPVI